MSKISLGFCDFNIHCEDTMLWQKDLKLVKYLIVK